MIKCGCASQQALRPATGCEDSKLDDGEERATVVRRQVMRSGRCSCGCRCRCEELQSDEEIVRSGRTSGQSWCGCGPPRLKTRVLFLWAASQPGRARLDADRHRTSQAAGIRKTNLAKTRFGCPTTPHRTCYGPAANQPGCSSGQPNPPLVHSPLKNVICPPIVQPITSQKLPSKQTCRPREQFQQLDTGWPQNLLRIEVQRPLS